MFRTALTWWVYTTYAVHMKRLLILTLGAALTGGACGTTASDAADTPLPSERGAGASTTQTAPGYREMTIPAGTTLPLALTSSVASDTSAVEDSRHRRAHEPDHD